MSASVMLRRRKGGRYKNAKVFKPFVRASVEGFLLGTTFKTKKTLAEALEAVDPRVNDTELIQRGEGLFTEGRWRKQSIAEIPALNTHIKRHPSVESCGEAPRSVEQEDSHYVGHVCFIDRLPGLSTIPDRPGITTMQEESAGSMIAPLSLGGARDWRTRSTRR